MRTTQLGSTSARISGIGLGAMPLSTAGRPDPASARGVVRAAVEAGVTLIDTADVYCLDETDYGHNERLVAEALREMGLRVGEGLAEPETPVVTTKGGRSRPGGDWGHAARPEQLRTACHASLKALGTERIELYQLHAPDPGVPFMESVGELRRLRDEGLIAHVGLSNVTLDQLREARAEVPIVSVQNSLSPWTASARPSPLIEYCERESITLLAYSPLGGAGRVAAIGRSDALGRLAEEVGATPHELVLAWLMGLSPAVVPIPGASRAASIRSSARAATLELDDTMRQRIQAAFAELPGRPTLLSRIAEKLKQVLRR